MGEISVLNSFIMNDLRPYQLDALKRSKERYEAGIRRQLIALPTGTGKTVVFVHAKMHHQIQGRVLVVVHRRELVEQAYFAFRTWSRRLGLSLRIGLEMGSNTSSSLDDIVVASVQSLGRSRTGRLAKFKADDFGLLICDEAHHSVASTYTNVFEHFGVLNGRSKALLLGVTATPVRSDGKGLGDVFDELVFHMDIRDAIIKGWLVDIKGARARTQTTLDGVRVMPSGDFDQVSLSKAINLQVRNQLVLKTWKERACDRQTVVFCADIQHAKDMAATFQGAGVRAEAIWGDDPDRKHKLEKHKRAELQVLTNCEVLTEGYDDWSISCVVMARPTQSELLFVQMVGRGTRIPKDVENLNSARAEGRSISKEDCLIIDVVDSTSKHSLITLPTLFGRSAGHDYAGGSVTNNQSDHSLMVGKAPSPGVAATVMPHIEDVDLLKIQWREPMFKESKLRWTTSSNGDQILFLPRGETFKISWNGHGWVVYASLKKQKFTSRPFRSLENAFRDVEDSLMSFCKELVRKLQSEKASKVPTEALQIDAAQPSPVPKTRIALTPEEVARLYSPEWFNTVLTHWSVDTSGRVPRFRSARGPTKASISLNEHGRWTLQISQGGCKEPNAWFSTAVQAVVRADEKLKHASLGQSEILNGIVDYPASRIQIELLKTMRKEMPRRLTTSSANALLSRRLVDILTIARSANRVIGTLRHQAKLH